MKYWDREQVTENREKREESKEQREEKKRSKGMTKIARELGVTRVGLYKCLSPDGKPSFDTIFKLFSILGLQIKLEQKSA